MDYRVVDSAGREVPKGEAKQALLLLGRGMEKLIDALESAHPYEISTVLSEIASIGRPGEGLYHVSQRFDGQRWFGFIEDIQSEFRVEFEIVQKQGREGVAYWEATLKLPFEWSSTVVYVAALFRRLDDEVAALKMRVEELKDTVEKAEETLRRVSGLSPKSLARLRRFICLLSRLSRAVEELEEEEEEEEEEW
jgi:hypothetical protein